MHGEAAICCMSATAVWGLADTYTAMLSSALNPGNGQKCCIRKQHDTQLNADVDGELLGSAPSLDVWTADGTRAQQAASPMIDLATSSSSGLGTFPIASLHLTRSSHVQSWLLHLLLKISFGSVLVAKPESTESQPKKQCSC